MKYLCRGPFCYLSSPKIQPGFYISSLAALCLGSVRSQWWQVVFQQRPCWEDRTARLFPRLQGPTCPAFPSGVCSSLHSCPLTSHPQKLHSFLLSCYLQDTTPGSQLYSPQPTAHTLQGPGPAVGTADLENSRVLTTTKTHQWLLYTSVPLLAPSGGMGTRQWVLRPTRCMGASLAKAAAAC